MPTFYLNIAVDVPLSRVFDYLPLADSLRTDYHPGQRVRVPFGRSHKNGLILSISASSELSSKQLKPIAELFDQQALLSSQDLALSRWMSSYYHHPIGEVCAQAMPKALRAGKPASLDLPKNYALSPSGQALQPTDLKRSRRQAELWTLLQQNNKPVTAEYFAGLSWDWRSPLKSMIDKGWVFVAEGFNNDRQSTAASFKPNSAQQTAIDEVSQAQQSFQCFLLDGVTGSGKTEVYLQLIQQAIAAGRQVLVLLPEITLTPQLAGRFKQRLACQMVISHSALSDGQRLQAWLQIQQGLASLLLGTRSAVFTPMQNPGLIILDEEHDSSFKQQEGFRYSARDVAIMRARDYNIPVLLGTATPSLESLYNVQQGRFKHLLLPERTAGASHPDMRLIDCRNLRLDNHLSQPLLTAIAKTLERDEQVILFVNRRGFAPVLMCHSCGWLAQCRHCDSRLVIHKNAHLLRCHHCGMEHSIPRVCPSCEQAELFPLGLGTERLEETLNTHFPDVPISRIDRDSTRKKDAMQSLIDKIHQGGAQIMVGTQMLAKGHHFPNVTLVGMVDVDGGLFSCDFRASERMSQLMIQVAGRAGREEKLGRVLIQTHHPEHPLLNTLIHDGYGPFAQQALSERQQAQLPPYHYQALLRVNALDEAAVLRFLSEVQQLISQLDSRGIEVLGPVPAPMLKRAGRFRYQLLLQSITRKTRFEFLHALLGGLDRLKSSRHIRWSIDVDPIDLF
ncbi:primosomal protein N' [Cycloclasticus sp. 46_83_sub15_T18]|nr:primosomal protein N' [Cycloclasticus sp. 46_83_sub15_T18]